MWVLAGLAKRTGTMEGWFVLILTLVMALTESTLEMQHSLFLCCFFPLLFGYRAVGAVVRPAIPS